ncbi:MAG: hypothetical protein ACOX8L_04030 [Candidatus Methanomethylophilaceae archaeon]|jgi:hypothetical protein
MLFRKDVPKEISAVKLSKWYNGLDDRNKNRLSRYIEGADVSSRADFLRDVISKAYADENYAAAILIGEAAESMDLTKKELFFISEEYILALYAGKNYGEAKRLCCRNLEFIPELYSDIVVDGVIPERMPCRNRLIDIMVLAEKDYDGADRMLERYCEMGILSEEDLFYRRQSLKIHRLQRTFDGIFTGNTP